MNDTDTEKHRLRIRVEVTKFAIFIGISILIVLIIEYANSLSDYNFTWIFVAVLLAMIVDKKFDKPVTKFYEKRLFNSKKNFYSN